MYGIFSREITIHTIMYGVYKQFWPLLCICGLLHNLTHNARNTAFVEMARAAGTHNAWQ